MYRLMHRSLPQLWCEETMQHSVNTQQRCNQLQTCNQMFALRASISIVSLSAYVEEDASAYIHVCIVRKFNQTFKMLDSLWFVNDLILDHTELYLCYHTHKIGYLGWVETSVIAREACFHFETVNHGCCTTLWANIRAFAQPKVVEMKWLYDYDFLSS